MLPYDSFSRIPSSFEANLSLFRGSLGRLGFKNGARAPLPVASVEGIERLQNFLDEVADLELTAEDREWVQVDVAAMLDGSDVMMHDVQPLTGAALLFLPMGVVMVEPTNRSMRHYPRSLLHLFIDDQRLEALAEGPLFRVELFSISPADEQLCWLFECYLEEDVPAAQAAAARWMRWLNEA